MEKPWTGLITVKLNGEFTFEVDETWDVPDEATARRYVDGELVNYIGEAFNDERFDETWIVEADNE